MNKPSKPVLLFGFNGWQICYIPQRGCYYCKMKPIFLSWQHSIPEKANIGYCLHCLITRFPLWCEQNSWGPGWQEKIIQFMKDNVDLCLEE